MSSRRNPQLQGADLGAFGFGSLERHSELQYQAVWLQTERLRARESPSERAWIDAQFYVFALDALLRIAELTKSHLALPGGGPMKSALRAFNMAVPDLHKFRDALDHYDEWLAAVSSRMSNEAKQSGFRPGLGILGEPATEVRLITGGPERFCIPLGPALLAAFHLAVATAAAHAACPRCEPLPDHDTARPLVARFVDPRDPGYDFDRTVTYSAADFPVGTQLRSLLTLDEPGGPAVYRVESLSFDSEKVGGEITLDLTRAAPDGTYTSRPQRKPHAMVEVRSTGSKAHGPKSATY